MLASSSVYRRTLLERLRLPFAWQSPAVDEHALPHETPLALVSRLARAKAAAVAPDHPSSLIIGSDQVAVIDGQILGKPGDAPQAEAQLAASAGRCVRFLTAVCVHDAGSGREVLEVVPCDVHFRALSAEEIRTYVALEQPYDCAGSFKAEALGIVLFDRLVTDDPSALTGLPLMALCRLLRTCGFDVLGRLSAQAAGHEVTEQAHA